MLINELAEQDFLDYSLEVIKNRAIPSIDGAKPIHRRILYIMQDEGNTSNKPTRKCAKISGSIMGRAHPHGSRSIYDALIRLSQEWKMRYPLIEVQGNKGNIQGDKAAAERYTECRLTPLGELMTKNINKKCIPTELNYSDEEELPLLLTSEFPNILCNPSLGIAVSMSSTTLPHNVTEVVDALIYYIKNNYNISVNELFKFIQGPDFPTGGEIINSAELKDIYAAGTGSIKIRSKYYIENINGKQHIVITEIPYLVNPMSKIYDVIKKMVTEDGYTDIDNIQNNIGNKGFELRIICAKNANVNKVIKDLCNKTGFQSSISMNNTVLINGKPKKLTFIELIKEYVNFRHQVIINIAKYDKEKAEARLHIVEGLLIAIADIDNIITLIKSCENKSVAKIKLIEKYNFTEIQANAILDMKLSKLTNLEYDELQTEKGELLGQIEYQNNIINNINNTRDNLLIEQFNNIKTKFGDKRRTKVNNIVETEEIEPIKTKSIINLVLENNTILPVDIEDKIVLNKKNNTLTKQNIKFGYITKNNEQSLLFDKFGKLYLIDNNTLNINSENILDYNTDFVCGLNMPQKQYLVTISKNGSIKKTSIEEYSKIKRPVQGVKIREDDELFFADYADDNDYVFVLGKEGGLIKTAIKDISTTGKNTIGSKIIADEVVSAAIGADNELYFTFADGKSKYSFGSDFNITAKGGKGQTITENTTIITKIDNYIYIIEKNNKLTKFTREQLSIKGKIASGAKISNEKFIKTLK